MKKHIFLFITLLLSSQCVLSEFLYHIGVKEGLNSRRVYQVCSDSLGFIWAYTNIGVDRFDGNEIRHYKLDTKVNSKDFILSSTVMECDKNGALWIALKNGDIYRYDRKLDSFVNYYSLSVNKPGLLLYNIFFKDNNTKLLCTSNGIFSLDDGKRLEYIALNGRAVNCITSIGNNDFIAGSNSGIYHISKDAKGYLSTKEINMPNKFDVISFLQYGNKLFVGTFSDGVYVVNLVNKRVHKLECVKSTVPVRSMVINRKNELLIGTDGLGIFSVDPDHEENIRHYIDNEDEEQNIKGNTISDLCIDRDGGIWMSTSTSGINYLSSDNSSFYRLEHKPGNYNSLKSDHVNVIFQDSDGDRWFGTNNGVSLFEVRSGRWHHFLTDKNNDAKVVLSIAQDRNGDIWVGGYGMGVYSITKKQKSVKLVNQININYVYSILSDGNYLWFGGIEGNVIRYDLTKRGCTNFPINCVGDFKHGYGNTILIAGCNGLGILDKKSGDCKWLNKFGNTKLQYPIRCLLYSSKGEIWMAGDGDGLMRFNPLTNEFHTYTVNDGISSNSILSLIEDDKGDIWFATEKELYCFDISKNKFFNSNTLLGLTWGAFNSNAAFKMSNGELAFGTAEGCIILSSSINVHNLSSVKIIFTDFKLLYQSVKAGDDNSVLKDNIDDTDKIYLKYDQNSFSISYSALSIKSRNRLRYEYMIENYDKGWLLSNYGQSVNYMNLPPGKYIFHLKAFDKYNNELVGERSLTICISQPWWLSWWAFVIYIILVIYIIYIIRQIRKQKHTEEKIKDKIRSFITIAHDIRTPVTLIKSPLNELDSQDDIPEQSRKCVNMALKNTEKLEAMINNLIDLQKSEKQTREQLNIMQYDIEAYLNEKIAEFSMMAMQKGVEMKLDVQIDMPKICMDREKMDHIIDNLFTNALKYTESGHINIKTGYSKKKWFLEIKDTGIGIPKEDQKNIFHEFYRAKNAVNSQETGSGVGLIITKRMVEQHNGEITFSSVEGEGTTFRISFPIIIKPSRNFSEDYSSDDCEKDYDTQESLSSQKDVLLLVEDDTDMREYLSSSLSNEYKIVTVADGDEALKVARKINPDIVITDVMMPTLRGDELCRILKSSVETSHIPVILLTALSERENIVFGLEAGASDYIIKPFDLTVLKVRIRNILKNRQILRDSVLSMNDEIIEELDYSNILDKEFIDKIMKTVQENINDSEFSINTLCRQMGMSRTSLYNKMKTLTGQGPNDFIRIVRLNKSKELLMSRRYSIGEVAVMVGFSDPKYFSTCFKKQFNISPSKI